MKTAFGLVILIISSIAANAATVTAPVTEDTSLYEFFPTNNHGASLHVAAGTSFAGKTRGLFRFDLAGKVPAGATVTAVKVNFQVIQNGSDDVFNLHRMLNTWIEGVGISPAGSRVGEGAPANPGEVTWRDRASPSTAWAQAGAFGPGDAVATASASATIGGPAAYSFLSTATLVSDVQGWVNNPSSNFGWLLKVADETAAGSARRFGSKETETTKATLEITYTPATASDVRITDFHLANGSASITWTGGLPNYRVERADSVTGPWTAVTTASSATTATAPLGGTSAFYRVASQLP